VRGAHCAEKIHHTHVTTPTHKGKESTHGGEDARVHYPHLKQQPHTTPPDQPRTNRCSREPSAPTCQNHA
jgi:hypothetical protein